MAFTIDYLDNPHMYQENTLPAAADCDIYANAQEADAKQTSRVLSLAGQWAVRLDMTADVDASALIAGDVEDGALLPLTVPGMFQLQYPQWDPPHYVNTQYPWEGHANPKQGEATKEYNPTANCVRVFDLTEAQAASRRTVLTLEGVETAVAVYMNGAYVGYSEDSFIHHRFDVTPYLKAGSNRLVLRVFKRSSGEWFEDQDFWRFSSIHRDVNLTFEGAAHLADFTVTTPVFNDYTDAKVCVKANVEGECDAVRVQLTDGEGICVWDETVPASGEVACEKEIKGAKLWSDEAPNLYHLRMTLIKADAEVEVCETDIGIREIKKIGGVFCLNGKRIVFHGVNRHEFDCDTGRVMTEELLMKDLSDMKRMNVNAIRTCHYPNCKLFYRLCDRYGMMVIDETNMETHGTWGCDAAFADPLPSNKMEWQDYVLARGAAMLGRDKNHACVVMWSCGNESFGGLVIYNLSEYFHHADPTRPVHYESVVNDMRYPDTTDIFSRMYAKVADIEKYFESNPAKPFMNCEYSHAMGNSCGGLLLYRELEKKYEGYQGGFIWDYVDQGLRTTAPNGEMRLAYGGDFGDRPTDRHFNCNGIILGDRTFTPKVQEVRHAFRFVEIEVDEAGITLHCQRRFAPLTDIQLRVTNIGGENPGETVIALDAQQPGEERLIPYEYKSTDESETIVAVRLETTKDTALLPAGTVIATGEGIFGLRDVTDWETAPETMIRSANNIGIRTKNMAAMVSRKEGLIALRDAAGAETLLQPPRPSLFRAPTDNDRGNKDANKQAPYLAFSLSAYPENKDGEESIVSRFVCPGMDQFDYTVEYTPLTDGMGVTVRLGAMENMPDLPAMGIQFLLDPRIKHVEYDGLGEMDTYCDRCDGALHGTYRYEVSDGWTRYARPQESGNRMDVTRLRLTDDNGHGLEITGESMEVSVQPYAPEQLMSVFHPDELVGTCRTVLDIAAMRKGIGGDDSWGAPVLPQYTYAADREYELKFVIRGI